ncbi:fungal pheromone STE3G-protein-coupled receptor, partial [Dissoconium aciculare CBS 342.82]|uniref:Fungal pheromone STE3G-protein-coupled receptor n=1 Tax=Dissoconium aciculare CBS 342.82 TaxID=1314786 RepID=A0A6J3M5N0_9PEZI
SPYPAAIAFAIFSLLTSLLITPTCIWHTRHRNVGATTVTVLAILANLMNFANALIWPHDDVSRWFSGVGYCDIQVKLQAVMQTAFPAALFCILRKLAAVLDTRKTAWATNATREQREFVIDMLICGALPWLQVISAFIVQPLRFFVSGIAGCQPVDDGTWLSALLLLAPRVLWTTACVYFSVLIVIRLIVYRRDVVSMLTHHDTNKSRFLRLYLLCAICIMGIFPLEVYIDYLAISAGLLSFDWTQTHYPTAYEWNSIVFIPSGGAILFDRYIWLAGGLLIFLTFGFGRDATKTYRELLVRLGLARFFP